MPEFDLKDRADVPDLKEMRTSWEGLKREALNRLG